MCLCTHTCVCVFPSGKWEIAWLVRFTLRTRTLEVVRLLHVQPVTFFSIVLCCKCNHQSEMWFSFECPEAKPIKMFSFCSSQKPYGMDATPWGNPRSLWVCFCWLASSGMLNSLWSGDSCLHRKGGKYKKNKKTKNKKNKEKKPFTCFQIKYTGSLVSSP